MSVVRIRTTIIQEGPAASIPLTEAQVSSLGGARNAPVTVTIGDRTARLRIGQMGGRSMVGLSRAARAELGIEYGDEVEADIALDTAERLTELPPELEAALATDSGAKAAFEALAPSRRKEMARAIAEAKAEETRQRRLEKALEQLRAAG
ncbi:YdeI/OmpD-associated family protein [Agrococcus sp. ARC_14]|uniref:YdeI/OmpD-associated family protein n=1 Tax=Agrococcus sp. ARC_14 TaxID=2919927 RepID=UPI001F0624BE|nr:YdeI/OmpD-associated family protein [Agrococcus sp. ARC_14]MCH1882561.1 YdeI/OmpD-associated family protein [Agrococcus sp. ARC_14]